MVRYGNQTPTQSVVVPYANSKGPDAVNLYMETGREPQEWQSNLVSDILAVNEDGLWTHSKFGYSVPRRNGKGEILTIIELYGLHTGINILHTAHRTTTSSSAAARLAKLLKDMGYTEILRVKKGEAYSKSYVYSKQFGLEKITLLDTGGTVSFRTRTSVGGLGEGYDMLIVDEAQEYTTDQQNTLQYVVSDSSNPLIILCGTPPTMISKGTVFPELRNACLSGETEETGWAEWSVEEMSDVNDIELWYRTNPAMGHQLNERKVKAEDKTDETDFNIQRLGLWVQFSLKSVITEQEWNDLEIVDMPKLVGKLFIGIKYGVDNKNVAMSLAVKTEDGRVFVESIDCRPTRVGNDWITAFLLKSKNVAQVVIDGASGQAVLVKDLKDGGVKIKPILPKVSEVIMANSQFEQSIGLKTICHKAQPSLLRSVSNCEKRNIGTNGGFGYKALKPDIEIALMDSVILAMWSCMNAKEQKKQQINY